MGPHTGLTVNCPGVDRSFRPESTRSCATLGGDLYEEEAFKSTSILFETGR